MRPDMQLGLWSARSAGTLSVKWGWVVSGAHFFSCDWGTLFELWVGHTFWVVNGAHFYELWQGTLFELWLGHTFWVVTGHTFWVVTGAHFLSWDSGTLVELWLGRASFLSLARSLHIFDTNFLYFLFIIYMYCERGLAFVEPKPLAFIGNYKNILIQNILQRNIWFQTTTCVCLNMSPMVVVGGSG